MGLVLCAKDLDAAEQAEEIDVCQRLLSTVDRCIMQ